MGGCLVGWGPYNQDKKCILTETKTEFVNSVLKISFQA